MITTLLCICVAALLLVIVALAVAVGWLLATVDGLRGDVESLWGEVFETGEDEPDPGDVAEPVETGNVVAFGRVA